jgi:hypothetical protein
MKTGGYIFFNFTKVPESKQGPQVLTKIALVFT